MKSIQQLPGLSDIKSVRSIGATSIPRVERSAHLELHVLATDKSRLEKELASLNKRTSTVRRNLGIINKQIETLQQETLAQIRKEKGESGPQKPLKTLTLDY